MYCPILMESSSVNIICLPLYFIGYFNTCVLLCVIASHVYLHGYDFDDVLESSIVKAVAESHWHSGREVFCRGWRVPVSRAAEELYFNRVGYCIVIIIIILIGMRLVGYQLVRAYDLFVASFHDYYL